MNTPILIKAVKFLSYLGIVALLFVPVYFYSSLPEEIPIHFNASGQANGYASKPYIWMIPSIGITLFALLSWLSKRPELFNHPVKITEENKEDLYALGAFFVQALNLLITSMMVYITFGICYSASHELNQLQPFFLFPFMGAIVLCIVLYFFKANRIK